MVHAVCLGIIARVSCVGCSELKWLARQVDIISHIVLWFRNFVAFFHAQGEIGELVLMQIVSRSFRLIGMTFLALMLLLPAPLAYAQFSSFDFAQYPNGFYYFLNTSTNPTAQIISATIDYTPTDTFFDTTADPPGLGYGLWSYLSVPDVNNVVLPNNALTNGQQIATILSLGNDFDPGKYIFVDADIDTFTTPDMDGAPTGGIITVLFSNGFSASGTITETPYTSGDILFYSPTTFTHSASGAVLTGTPEPSSFVLMGIVLIGMGAVIRRRRSV